MLEELKLVSWIDVWAIPAAADWRAEIERGLLACRGCAIFLGASGWGEFHLAEARRALEHRTERPDFIVVPILLPGAREEDIAVLGELFSDRQRIDFNDPATENESLMRLAAAFRGEQPFPLGRPRMSPYTIRRDANRWIATGGKDASILYRGRTLRAAQELATTYSGQLDAAAFRFLTAAADGERRRLRAAIAGALLVVMAIVGLLIAVEWSRRSARNRLASLYVENGRDAVLRRDPAAALYLHAALDLGARDSDLPFLLSRAMQPLAGQIASLGGHTDAVNETDLSADGRTAATAGADHIAVVWSLPDGKQRCVLRGHRDGVRTIRFSRDGRRVLTASIDETARIWDAATCRSLAELAIHDGVASEAIWSEDGNVVAVSTYGGTVGVWDASNGKPLARWKGTAAIDRLAFVADRIAFDDGKGTVQIWDWRQGRTVAAKLGDRHLAPDHVPETVNDLAVTRDGRVGVALDGPLAIVWTPATDARLVLRGDNVAFERIAFSPDGSRVLATDTNGVLRVWDAAHGTLLFSVDAHRGFTESASFDRSGQWIVTAGSDGTAKVWQTGDGGLLAILDGLQGKLHHACFSSDGNFVATSGDDGRAILWDWRAARGPGLWKRADHRGKVSEARFAADGTRVVTGSQDGSAIVYDVRRGRIVSRIEVVDPVESVDITRDGASVAVAFATTAEVHDASTGALVERSGAHTEAVQKVRFHPAGGTFATASADHTARIWEIRSERVIATLPHKDSVVDLMYDRRGDRLLTASLDATATLWNAASGARVHTLAGHHYPVAHAAISDDGATAVTAELAARLTVWDARTGTRKAELTGHSGYINDCALSHDGARVGSAGSDRTARIWDASAGSLIHILDGHEGRVVAIRFSPDDTLAATVTESAEVRLWSVATGRLLARVSASENGFATVAEFTPAGDALLTADGDGIVSLWSFPKETRTADEIAPVLARLVPYRLQQGRAVPQSPGDRPRVVRSPWLGIWLWRLDSNQRPPD